MQNRQAVGRLAGQVLFQRLPVDIEAGLGSLPSHHLFFDPFLVVRSEAFVEPQVAPCRAREEIAEPGVTELVRDDAVRRHHVGMISGDHIGPDEVEFRILHPAAEFRREHQIVTLEWIRTDDALRGAEHVRNELHLPGRVVDHLWLRVDAGAVVERTELQSRCGERDQICRNRMGHRERVNAVRIRVGGVGGAHQRQHARLYADRRVVCHAHRRCVLQRNPAARQIGLARGEESRHHAVVRLLRRQPMQPWCGRPRAVIDAHDRRVRIDVDEQGSAVGCCRVESPVRGFSAGTDAVDVQAVRVDDESPRSCMVDDRVCRGTGDDLPIEIYCEIERQVDALDLRRLGGAEDIDRSIAEDGRRNHPGARRHEGEEDGAAQKEAPEHDSGVCLCAGKSGVTPLKSSRFEVRGSRFEGRGKSLLLRVLCALCGENALAHHRGTENTEVPTG